MYDLGHDRPEMYVFAKPDAGRYLLHAATIELEAEGQAFAFEPGETRIVWVVDRRKLKVRRIRLPEVGMPAAGRGFREWTYCGQALRSRCTSRSRRG